MNEQAEPDRGMGAGALVLSCLVALVVGAVAGLLTTFAHAQLAPWALLAGLAIALALVLGFRLVFASRIVAGAAGLGFVAGSVALSFPSAGAAVLTLDDPTGWIWAIGPALLMAAAIVQPWPDGWPGRRSARL